MFFYMGYHFGISVDTDGWHGSLESSGAIRKEERRGKTAKKKTRDKSCNHTPIRSTCSYCKHDVCREEEDRLMRMLMGRSKTV